MFSAMTAAVTSSFERAPWGWATLVLLLAGYLKLKPVLVKLAQEREANLLQERAGEMASMRERLEAMETKLEIASEELRIVRHDLANANTALDLLLARIESDPDNSAEHARLVRQYREKTQDQIREEKMALAKVRVSNIGGGS